MAASVMHVQRLGFWAVNRPDTRFAFSDDQVECEMPAIKMIDRRAKRGTSRVARMLVEVAHQASQGGAKDVPTVFASAWGEIQTMTRLFDQIYDGEAALSPLLFKNSVHNTASGMLSIAVDNQGLATAIAAGPRTFEAGIIEAYSLLGEHDEVVLAVGDDLLIAPLDSHASVEPLALAFRLSNSGEGALGSISAPRSGRDKRQDVPVDVRTSRAGENPTLWAMPIYEALAQGTQGTFALYEDERWVVDVDGAKGQR